mmetsp:Transcript_8475/g.22155  ORF Transcript_8475/g.22155 Transcript_8475/m.22155 type:complete len:328 (-) Transcript_8475:232-1215(-)
MRDAQPRLQSVVGVRLALLQPLFELGLVLAPRVVELLGGGGARFDEFFTLPEQLHLVVLLRLPLRRALISDGSLELHILELERILHLDPLRVELSFGIPLRLLDLLRLGSLGRLESEPRLLAQLGARLLEILLRLLLLTLQLLRRLLAQPLLLLRVLPGLLRLRLGHLQSRLGLLLLRRLRRRLFGRARHGLLGGLRRLLLQKLLLLDARLDSIFLFPPHGRHRLLVGHGAHHTDLDAPREKRRRHVAEASDGRVALLVAAAQRPRRRHLGVAAAVPAVGEHWPLARVVLSQPAAALCKRQRRVLRDADRLDNVAVAPLARLEHAFV